MPRTRRGCLAFGVLVLAVVGLTACGGAGSEPHQVEVLVTQDFGRVPVGGSARAIEAPASDSALDVLRRVHDVTTSADGRHVVAVDGRRAQGTTRWFLYVNGIRPENAAGQVGLHRGDRVWFDRHDGGAAPRIRGVVGSFPEPLVHGRAGKRLPVRLECADDAQRACDIAAEGLHRAGIGVVARARIGTTGGDESVRVLVGRWPEIRSDFVVRRLELGPRRSGVFARPAPDGRSIALLDARGRFVRRAAPGTGLVAATEDTEVDAAPVWIVTAVDGAGLRQAAAALSEDALRGGFAVAVRDELPTDLPVHPSAGP